MPRGEQKASDGQLTDDYSKQVLVYRKSLFYWQPPAPDGIKGFDMAMNTAVDAHIRQLLPSFFPRSSLLCVSPLGEGNINDTYLLNFSDRDPVVLQRLNAEVFPEPIRVADNVMLVTEHIRNRQKGKDVQRKTLHVIASRSGRSCCLDDDGAVWRMVKYFADTQCLTSISSLNQAFEGGGLLGWFHRQLEHLSPDLIGDPLPGFHDLPAYCRHYRQALLTHTRKAKPDLSYCVQQADRRLADGDHLHSLSKIGKTARRVIHGDPKIGNMLFDRESGRAVALIDLDTVSAGNPACDLGDCLRSFCNVMGEDPPQPADVVFDLDICRAMLEGYRASGASFAAGERELVYQGVRLLTYELGLRFLTDYLNHDTYFKVTDEDKNLRRAVVQFLLLSSIEQQQEAIQKIAREV